MNQPAATEPLRLRRIPLLAITLSFAVGICIAKQWQSPCTLACATILLFSITLLCLFRARGIAVVPAFGLCVITGAWCAQIEPSIETHPALLNDADGLSRIVRGRVTRVRLLPQTEADATQALAPWKIEPGGWETESRGPRQSVDLAIDAVEQMSPDTDFLQPTAGGVRVLLTGDALPLHCGEVLEIPLRMRSPDVYRDPGAFSYAEELLSEKIDVHATADSSRVRKLNAGPMSLHCQMYAAQSWASAKLDTFFDSAIERGMPHSLRLNHDDEAMLRAILFGDRAMLSTQLRDSFQATGTFHLFVVSGLHIALLAAGVYAVLKKCRLPEGNVVLLTLTFAALYTLLSGNGVPARRALLMTAVFLIARWLDREITTLNSLGFAALVVLVVDPRALFESGFQMTALVVLAAGGIAAPLLDRCLTPHVRALRQLDIFAIDAFLPPRLAQFRVRVRMAGTLCKSLLGDSVRNAPAWLLRSSFYLIEGFLVSLAVELCMTVPMAVYFHRATVFALPLNVLNIPLLAILLCAAAVTFASSLVSSWLAIVPAAITALLLHVMRFSVLSLHALSFADLRVPSPTKFLIAGACTLITACCLLLREQKRVWVVTGILCALLIPIVTLHPPAAKTHPDALEVTALDVGQGDSLLTVSPAGETMLIDAGGPTGRDTPTTWDIGEQIVAPYLWQRHIRKLDVAVLTHAHSDHMGGMPAVLRDLRPRELWLSVEPGNSPSLRALIDQARLLQIPIKHLHAGEVFKWSDTQVSVLAPESAYVNSGAPTNDDSLVLRLDYGRASVLLEGDAQSTSEDTMLNKGRLAPVTLLKIGHHGSKTSSTPEFLAAVTPQDAVISVGRHNTFGHPRFDVLERLEAAHIRTYRTDREGAETFLLHADGSLTATSANTPD